VLRRVEQTLAVAARSGLDIDGQLELSAIVDDYVFGYAMRMYSGASFGAEDQDASAIDAIVAYFNDQLATCEYPNLQRVSGDDVAAGLRRIGHTAQDDDRFERGLRRLLDGLELWIDSAANVKPRSSGTGAGRRRRAKQ
jgi:tetracycline repressor-like protein